MQFPAALGALLAFVAAVSADTVSWDASYDDADRSLTAVSCSDGANGMMGKHGWQTQGQVPGFPNIAGAVDIAGWNSDKCGQCFRVSYNGGAPIHVVGIDRAGAGLNLSRQAMARLTNNQADQPGRVNATVERVGPDQCGLTASKRTVHFHA